MSASRVDAFVDSGTNRDGLAQFLAESFPGSCDAEKWLRRFRHWWDENPFAAMHSARGWTLKAGGRLVGYLGAIPGAYSIAGECRPAVLATTWVVLPEHRDIAGVLGLRFFRESSGHLLIATTLRAESRQALLRKGWQGRTEKLRRFVPLGRAWGFLSQTSRWDCPGLHSGRRVVADVHDVRSVRRPFQSAAQIEKWITPEYLRWYLCAPMRSHQFTGIVDDAGCMTSYVIVAPTDVKGIPSWQMIDWFTTLEDEAELMHLAAALAAAPPQISGETRWLLTLPAFPPDDPWKGMPHLWKRQEEANLLYHAPPGARWLPKRTVPAEGDWGL